MNYRRYGYGDRYTERDPTPHETAYELGKSYMQGKASIADVELHIRRKPGKETHASIRSGVAAAEAEGKAVSSRVQPKQEGIRFGPNLGKRRTSGGKLAARPDHTRYKTSVATGKETPKQKAERHVKFGLNEYEVKSQRKKDLKILLDKHARGGYGVKEVKREAKVVAAGAARKNVVYNETKHRFVGNNRVTR